MLHAAPTPAIHSSWRGGPSGAASVQLTVMGPSVFMVSTARSRSRSTFTSSSKLTNTSRRDGPAPPADSVTLRPPLAEWKSSSARPADTVGAADGNGNRTDVDAAAPRRNNNTHLGESDGPSRASDHSRPAGSSGARHVVTMAGGVEAGWIIR